MEVDSNAVFVIKIKVKRVIQSKKVVSVSGLTKTICKINTSISLHPYRESILEVVLISIKPTV